MPPGVIGGAIGAVGSIGGALIGSSAAGSAAERQAAAAAEANGLQKRMYDLGRNDQNPYRQAGMSALYGAGGMFKRKDGGSGIKTNLDAVKSKWIDDHATHLANTKIGNVLGTIQNSQLREQVRSQMMGQMDRLKAESMGEAANNWNTIGAKETESQVTTNGDDYELDQDLTRKFTNDDFTKDPGYDFRMQEGQKALERSAAARGGLQNGGTMKALAEYGQGFASNEYQNAYNRFNNDQSNRFNRLSSIAGMGQGANAANAQAGQNYAGQVGNNNMSSANAQGAAGIAQGNAWGGALSSIGKIGMDIGAQQEQQNWMQRQQNSLNAKNHFAGSGGGY